MKHHAFLSVACAAALAGCDFTVPLAETPDTPIDPGLVGLWERCDDHGEVERLLVLPLGDKEYLVSFPAASPNSLFARATLCKAGSRTLLQMTWFGTAQGAVADTPRVYQYATFAVAGDTLTGSLLNADVVNREADSAAALLSAIEANGENPALFREEWRFTKVKKPVPPGTPPQRPPMPPAWR